MPWHFSSRRFSFFGKLLAVACCITLMVALVIAMALWIVDRQFTHRYEKEVKQKLKTAEAVFQHTREARTRHLRSRNRQAANEPRIRALTQTDPATVEHVLREDLIGEQSLENAIDGVSFADKSGRILANAAADTSLDLARFGESISPLVLRAIEMGELQDATLSVGDRLFDVVATPIFVSGLRAGALAFALEVGSESAAEFKRLTQSEITLIANGHVVATTVSDALPHQRLVDIYSRSSTRSAGLPNAPFHPIELNGEQFLGIAGSFEPSNPIQALGYVLLISYDEALRDLRVTRYYLVVIGFIGTLLAGVIAGLSVHKITAPLRELRNGAEALEHGNLRYQVPITSHDEFGELASTFNRMTTSLRTSREELERTVEMLQTTQGQLVQSEKLSAIGQFVAGVAHELNNPLTSVMGYAGLLKESNISDEDKEYADQVIQNADRCAKIVRNLLSFARQAPPSRKTVGINQLLEETLRLFPNTVQNRNISIWRNFDASSPVVVGDSHQIQQVFFNIINNALQEMQSREREGSLRISTESSQGKVRATFVDDGPGILPQHLAKLFTPFYTTKDVGKGIGLGLSVSYGIVKEHGGDITVQSEPGQGATFIVELPMAEVAFENDVKDPEAGRQIDQALKELNKNVLVVDDEVSIGGLVQHLLIPLGLRVTAVTRAETGLSMLGEKKFDFVLSDCKMPGIGGFRFYEEVRATYPEMASQFLFMSGDIFNPETEKFMKQYNLTCLSKPFSTDELKKAIAKLGK